MSLSFSIILIAAGAILAFAVQDNVAELDLAAIGWIIMIVGIIGALLSLLFWSSFAPFADSNTVLTRRRRPTTYVDDAPVQRRTVVDEYEAPATPVRRTTTTEEQTHDRL
ncbi:MAG: DUF6458 family protein [Dehalococcoidia bacterium]